MSLNQNRAPIIPSPKGRGKMKASAPPRLKRRVSWSQALEEVNHFEGGSSQSEDEEWVDVDGGNEKEAAAVAMAVNAAADAAIYGGSSDGDGAHGYRADQPPQDGSRHTEICGMVRNDDDIPATVEAAAAAATAAEEMLLGKGLLADNITDSQFRTSRIVLLDRGTAIKPLGE